MRARAALLLASIAVALAACGYRSAVPGLEAVRVAAVTARAPTGALASCVTTELREGLAARGIALRRAAPAVLEGEILEAGAGPGTLAAGDVLEPTDQAAELVLRARLVHRSRGVVWGPVVYRVRVEAPQGEGPLESVAAADVALERGCRRVAERVLGDLADVDVD